MLDALKSAGCRILFASPADTAPFVFTFETAAGERMGVVAYAFLATRTLTKNRPLNERSFQLKYGSKASYAENNSHVLWQDPLGLFTTLLVGIDPEEGFFVAADPEAHNPTKLFIRLEFKDEHVDLIKLNGWHSWERTRRGAMADPIEVLVGGTKDAFLELIRFERAAYGLSPGDRQLLAEKRDLLPAAAGIGTGLSDPVSSEMLHPILREFQLGADEVLGLIAGARRLKMAVRGWVAEEHLRETLSRVPGVTHCERLDIEGGPDLRVRYRDGPFLSVECKNALREVSKTTGLPRIDFQRTRAAKHDPCSRYYAASDFDIVAGCLHAVTVRWEFRYALPRTLDDHRHCPGKLASNVLVDERWTEDPRITFEAAAGTVM
ncbi:MAG: hypothetical protein KJZ76_16840 [Burkholderiaceae bacterium]|nr:hypothetical protein [Burkholderiaceae bacterium]